METSRLIILKQDEEILKTHFTKSAMSDFNKRKLMLELENALVVKADALPADVVCLESEVEILDLETKQTFRFQLVKPSEANVKKNKISVFAPIGIALIGYRVGARVQWEMPNGLKSFEILRVDQKTVEQEVTGHGPG